MGTSAISTNRLCTVHMKEHMAFHAISTSRLFLCETSTRDATLFQQTVLVRIKPACWIHAMYNWRPYSYCMKRALGIPRYFYLLSLACARGIARYFH
jgi:hypothetical protein